MNYKSHPHTENQRIMQQNNPDFKDEIPSDYSGSLNPQSPLPKQEGEWEKRFDKEIGIIEGYKLCITYEDQNDQDVEHQVKDLIRKEIATAHQQGYAEGKKGMIAKKDVRAFGLTMYEDGKQAVLTALPEKKKDNEMVCPQDEDCMEGKSWNACLDTIKERLEE